MHNYAALVLGMKSKAKYHQKSPNVPSYTKPYSSLYVGSSAAAIVMFVSKTGL